MAGIIAILLNVISNISKLGKYLLSIRSELKAIFGALIDIINGVSLIQKNWPSKRKIAYG